MVLGPEKQFRLVTKGSLGSKLVVSGITPPISKIKIPIIKLNLDARKEALLKQHSKGHTKRHMDYMRQQMLLGLSYKDAHQRAVQFIGR